MQIHSSLTHTQTSTDSWNGAQATGKRYSSDCSKRIEEALTQLSLGDRQFIKERVGFFGGKPSGLSELFADPRASQILRQIRNAECA